MKRTVNYIFVFICFLMISVCIGCDYPPASKMSDEVNKNPQESTSIQRQYEIVILDKGQTTIKDPYAPDGIEHVYRIVHKSHRIKPEKTDWHTFHENVDKEQYDYYEIGKTYISDKAVIGW